MKRIGVLTSGGDAPGMNAAVRAVTRSAIHLGMEVVGIRYGYEGLIEGDFTPLTIDKVGGIMQNGGTILKTARSERFRTEEGQQKALVNLRDAGIDALICIGGDGTYRGAMALEKLGVDIVGIPGTIDNDMGYTDFTIGFDTALNTILDNVGKIKDTADAHDRTTIIEVMGRDCGDLALYAGITGGAEYVLIPENELDIDEICASINEAKERGKSHFIIIRAEGFHVPTHELASMIQEKTGQEAKISVLGYIQRGGSPTARDRLIATLMGEKAVELIYNDEYGKAVGVSGNQAIVTTLDEAVNTKSQPDLDLMALFNKLA